MLRNYFEFGCSGCVAGSGSGPDPSTESNPLYSSARGRRGPGNPVGAPRRDAGCGPRHDLYRSRALWACAGRTKEALCCWYGPVDRGGVRGPWALHRGQGHRFRAPKISDPYLGCRSNKRARRWPQPAGRRGKVDRVERAQIFFLLS